VVSSKNGANEKLGENGTFSILASKIWVGGYRHSGWGFSRFGFLGMGKFDTSVRFLPVLFLPKIGTGSSPKKVYWVWGTTPYFW